MSTTARRLVCARVQLAHTNVANMCCAADAAMPILRPSPKPLINARCHLYKAAECQATSLRMWVLSCLLSHPSHFRQAWLMRWAAKDCPVFFWTNILAMLMVRMRSWIQSSPSWRLVPSTCMRAFNAAEIPST